MAPNDVNPDLEEISERPENLFCGECRAKAPKWASVNLGVLFCIDCSGAHRGLGTHISVVKSTTLDKWQQKWVDAVSALGNTVVNDFFEHNLPEGARPQATDREAMARFIRAKYEKRQWAPEGQMAPHELMAQGRLPGAKAAQSPGRQGPLAASPPIPAAPAPAVDLLCMDDVQTPAAAAPPPALEAIDLLGGMLALAPPPAQRPQEQHQAPATGLQSLQGGLASLYQQPQEQPPQSRFAALSTPAGTWGSAPGGLTASRPSGQHSAWPQPAAPYGAFGPPGGRSGAAMPQLPAAKAYLPPAVSVQPAMSKLDSFGAIDPFSAFSQPRAIRQSA